MFAEGDRVDRGINGKVDIALDQCAVAVIVTADVTAVDALDEVAAADGKLDITDEFNAVAVGSGGVRHTAADGVVENTSADSEVDIAFTCGITLVDIITADHAAGEAAAGDGHIDTGETF